MILVLSLLLLVAGTTIFFLTEKLDTALGERDQAISFNNSKDDSLTHYISKYGQEVAKNHIQDLTVRNLRKMQHDERLSWISKFDGVNKRLNNVEQATRTTAHIVGSFHIPLADTVYKHVDGTLVKAKTFNNKDPWLNLSGVITGDSVLTKADVPVPLESIILWERKGKFLPKVFGRKEYSTQTTSANPYVKITKHELTRFAKKPRK